MCPISNRAHGAAHAACRSSVDKHCIKRYGRTVIRALGKLEEGVCRRWLGPALALILVVLVLLIGLHPVADHFVEHAALTCAVIALVGAIVVPAVGGKPSPLPDRPAEVRLPAGASVRIARVCLADGQGSFPLRR